jgi:hypothetical protein
MAGGTVLGRRGPIRGFGRLAASRLIDAARQTENSLIEIERLR